MTSHLPRFLATNDAPSDQEALEVRTIHDKAQRDWRTNKAQMSLLEGRAGSAASMETLRRQDISLRQTIHAYRCILSPLRRFPPEILAHIFLLSAPSVSEARYVPWYTSLEGSPWTLAHVSRHWREVALSFPVLWSTIIIRNMSDGESEIYSLPMLEAQLARSAKTPLNIIFDYEAFNDPSDGDVVEDALNALMRHSSRWKSLYITESQIPRLVSVRGRLPLLEKLSVFGGEGEEDDDGNSPPPQANYFLPAPRLRNVAADNAFLAFDVPWAQLTHYEALGPWAGHIAVLPRLRNVESCSLTIADEADFRDPYAWGNTIVELPELRELQLTTERFIHGIEKHWVWPKWLRLPYLMALAIPDGLLQGLPQLQQASSAFALEKLHIIAGCPAVAALRPVLLSNPDILELLLTLDSYGAHSRDFSPSKVPALLDFLTFTPHHEDPLAELETLIIRFPTSNHEDAIGRMIASRWGTTRLLTVHAVNIGPTLTSHLNRMKNEGLEVFIRRTESRTSDHSYGDYQAPFQLDYWKTV